MKLKCVALWMRWEIIATAVSPAISSAFSETRLANCVCGLLIGFFCFSCGKQWNRGCLVLVMACINSHGFGYILETHVLDFAAVCLLVVLVLRCWEMIRYFCGGWRDKVVGVCVCVGIELSSPGVRLNLLRNAMMAVNEVSNNAMYWGWLGLWESGKLLVISIVFLSSDGG